MMFPAEIEALARDRQERMERELRREMLYRKARQNRVMPGRTGVGLLPRVGRLAVQFVFWPYIRPTIRRLGLWLQDVGRWMAGGRKPSRGGDGRIYNIGGR